MLTNLELFQPSEIVTDDAAPVSRKARQGSKSERASDVLPPPTRYQRHYLPVRRVLDIVLTLGMGVLAAPIVALGALAVKLSSRGPAFYVQNRIGRDGVPFTIYKIRTMIHNCESLTGPRWTIPGDPRVTAVGWLLRRTHLDELPQLLNVLRGDMSLIGPRPERPEFVAKLEKAVTGYRHRHRVLPGITGLAQVQLPPDTDLESVRRKLLYDLHYVRNVSLFLDARILLATGLHLLGVPFPLLAKLHIVPRKDQLEAPAALPLPETMSFVHKRAA